MYLGKRDRTKLLPYFPYLKILLTALHKLPPCTDVTVNRGVKLHPLPDGSAPPPLADRYNKGDEPIWWGFGSATSSIDALQDEQFLGMKGSRTIFQLKVRRAVKIKKYSAIQAEDETLILCGTPFIVNGKVNMGNDLWMVQMEEAFDAPAFVTGFSFVASEGGSGGSGGASHIQAVRRTPLFYSFFNALKPRQRVEFSLILMVIDADLGAWPIVQLPLEKIITNSRSNISKPSCKRSNRPNSMPRFSLQSWKLPLLRQRLQSRRQPQSGKQLWKERPFFNKKCLRLLTRRQPWKLRWKPCGGLRMLG
jgi:hypothetical protein